MVLSRLLWAIVAIPLLVLVTAPLPWWASGIIMSITLAVGLFWTWGGIVIMFVLLVYFTIPR